MFVFLLSLAGCLSAVERPEIIEADTDTDADSDADTDADSDADADSDSDADADSDADTDADSDADTDADTDTDADVDTGPAVWDLIFHEVHADPSPSFGDANCDGVIDSGDDEFIELLNLGPDSANLAGVSILDNTGVRHSFSAGTWLGPGQLMVVYGAGTPSCIVPDALFTTSSTGMLGLNNGGDTLRLLDSDGLTLDSYSYGVEGGNDVSLTRALQGQPSAWAPHTSLSADPYSPGEFADPNAPTCSADGVESGTVLISDSTCGANDDWDLACVSGGEDLEFEWTAPSSALWTFSVTWADFDPALAVRTCSDIELACNDDSNGTLPSVQLNLNAGEKVVLVVDGFSGGCGNFDLSVF